MWKAVRITYYEDNKDRLLTEAIKPAVEKLQTRGLGRWFLRRHWKRGPHISLVLEDTNERLETDWLPLIRETVLPWLNDHPSRKEIDPDQYLKLSETLGAWELEPGPYLPLSPDNSLNVEPHDRREDVVSGARVAELLEAFRSDVAPVTLELIAESAGNRGKRLEQMIGLMAVIAELYPLGGITRGHLSYRSHVEGYLHTFDTDGRLRETFRQRDRELGGRIDELVRAVLAHTGEEGGVYHGPDRWLRAWAEASLRLYTEAKTLADAGELTSRTDHYREIAATIGEEAVKRWDPSGNERGLSPFHQNLQSREEGMRVLQSPEFAAYRIVVNAFYAHLPLFDINPHTKHLLCELVSNATERIKGVTWQQLTGFGQGGTADA
ncbi:lantibiotic dehydratase C-terminal domain-containing protein [Staphylospora marina]|uniref:lantibiotic dehydratase C-terminal domain-containing protein n=1 Tax=Staphylospora marina TaxID=2490858 RepID=UPI000F5BE84C|nr:lantibiotic dehydratase C-terminal domain-containing protein [Staphylospora marina]